jgi:hypothetical protein
MMTEKIGRLLAGACLLAAFGVSSAFGQFNPSGTTNVSVTVGAEAAIQVDSTGTPLTTTGGIFADFVGSTNFSYKVRTSRTSGSGAITVQITTDFSPTGGPSVQNAANGDTLKFGCTLNGVGTACSGLPTISFTAATTVAQFGANARSSKNGDAGALAWTLTNDPAYEAGSYTATATFTISAT